MILTLSKVISFGNKIRIILLQNISKSPVWSLTSDPQAMTHTAGPLKNQALHLPSSNIFAGSGTNLCNLYRFHSIGTPDYPLN